MRTLKALWLISPIVGKFASGEDPEQGILACPQASARLRMGIAAVEWRRAGNQNVFLDPEDSRAVGSTDFGTVRICVVQKFFFDSEFDRWFETCSAAKKSGSRLVVDISDLPFHKRPPSVRRFYDEVLKICDAVVVNSEKMAELIAPYTSRRPRVIEDAIIGAARKPEFAPDKTLKLLWFGHPRNLPFLRRCLDSLAPFAMQRRCRLTIVTEDGHGAEELTRAIASQFAPAFEARFIRWSLEAMRIALRNCDLVLLPSDPSNPIKAGASPNRIAEALNAGRFPIASPLPSYLPFSDSAWLGPDLVEGIKWALANRGEVLARIRRGQALVMDKFAAEKIGCQWREFFEGLA
jgi:hypothetical protein